MQVCVSVVILWSTWRVWFRGCWFLLRCVSTGPFCCTAQKFRFCFFFLPHISFFLPSGEVRGCSRATTHKRVCSSFFFCTPSGGKVGEWRLAGLGVGRRGSHKMTSENKHALWMGHRIAPRPQFHKTLERRMNDICGVEGNRSPNFRAPIFRTPYPSVPPFECRSCFLRVFCVGVLVSRVCLWTMILQVDNVQRQGWDKDIRGKHFRSQLRGVGNTFQIQRKVSTPVLTLLEFVFDGLAFVFSSLWRHLQVARHVQVAGHCSDTAHV